MLDLFEKCALSLRYSVLVLEKWSLSQDRWYTGPFKARKYPFIKQWSLEMNSSGLSCNTNQWSFHREGDQWSCRQKNLWSLQTYVVLDPLILYLRNKLSPQNRFSDIHHKNGDSYHSIILCYMYCTIIQ